MQIFIMTKALFYIILEIIFAYKLEKSNLFNRKYFYILALLVISLEIIKIKNFTSDFWDRQVVGFLIGYLLYFFIRSHTKKD